MTMVLSASADNEKYSMSGMTITDIVSSDITKNKSFVLNTGLDSSLLSGVISNGFLCIYKKDDEFTLGYSGISTTNDANDGENGVVGKYSEFYSKYYNGNINTGDYFYSNRCFASSADINISNTDYRNIKFLRDGSFFSNYTY